MIDPAFLGTLAFAVSAGVATFFAPCAFPLLPGYVGFYVRNREGGVLAPAVAAAAGALVALAVVGSVGFAVGRAVVSHLALFEPVAGVALVVLGAAMYTGRSPQVHLALPERPGSVLGMAAFGAVYALAAAGCVVPVLVGLLTQLLTLPPSQGAVAFGTYAGSVALPLVGVTLLADAGLDAWTDLGKHVGRLHRAAAAVMVLAGLGQLYLSLVVIDVFGLF
ncbi:MAG: cytochrome c biogenesis CcdA family protein [Haloferacaceae archaeon]